MEEDEDDSNNIYINSEIDSTLFHREECADGDHFSEMIRLYSFTCSLVYVHSFRIHILGDKKFFHLDFPQSTP